MTSNSPLLRSAAEGSPEFDTLLSRLQARGDSDLSRVEPAVREILDDVRQNGDAALARYVERFEGRKPATLFRRDYGGKAALDSLTPAVREALELGAARIRTFHEHQRERLGGFEYEA